MWLSWRILPLVLAGGCHFSVDAAGGPSSDFGRRQGSDDLALGAGDDLAMAAFDLRGADLGPVPGSITHTFARPPATVAFAGDTDWVHFGSKLERKHNVNLISDATATGVPSASPGSCNVAFSWTDGAPDLVSTADDCLIVAGKGNGFSLTAPAGVARRTLTVWLGSSGAAVSVNASLSDSSASDGDVRTDSGTVADAYAFTYNAASDAQTITIEFHNANAANQGSVQLLAAELR